MLTSVAQKILNDQNMALFSIGAFAMFSVLFAVMLFVISALLMVTYNNSIPKMNSNWEKIDYKTSIVLTLFLMFIPRTM